MQTTGSLQTFIQYESIQILFQHKAKNDSIRQDKLQVTILSLSYKLQF